MLFSVLTNEDLATFGVPQKDQIYQCPQSSTSEALVLAVQIRETGDFGSDEVADRHAFVWWK